MPVATEEHTKPRLTTEREPVGRTVKGAKGTIGDKAVIDAVVIVLAAWVVLFFLVFSLRRDTV